MGGVGGGGLGDGGAISTDFDTITVPSPLLPHHFWPRSQCALGIERPSYLAEDLVSQASNAGPSSHTLCWGGHTGGPALCIFTHFSQRGSRNP